MLQLHKIFVVVTGLQSLVSNIMSVKAASTTLHVNNVTSLVFGEHVTLLCNVNSTDNQMISGVALSRMIKSEIEPIARWSSGKWTQFVQEGRNWTATFDNRTGAVQLNIPDLNNEDVGIYFCAVKYNKISEKSWLNLTLSDQVESGDKTAHRDIVDSLPSQIGLPIGLSIIGIVAISSGLIFAYFKRRVWLPKLACKRTITSSQEELQHIENIRYVHRVISEIIGLIEVNGLDTEGIYRKSCAQWELTKARQDIQKDFNTVKSLPVITLCNVMKMFIRELDPPLINEEVEQELLRANAFSTESEKSTRMKSALQQLDSTHLECLRDLILHLRRVAENAEVNKMTAENLAVVFAPSIMRTAPSCNHKEPLAAVNAAKKDTTLKGQVISLLIKSL